MKTWEQRKLGEIYGSIGNAFVGTATPYYVEQGHFYLESNNVKDGQINHNSEIFINDEFYEKQKDKWLHSGDVVMVQSGHVGHAAVIPKELNNTAAHALIMFRNPKEEIEPYFLNYEYQTDKVKKKIENITTGNTIKHILASDMQEFVVDVPKYEEQKVIASYFSHLDHLITLHQRKCYRFIDIALDAWEQRKLDGWGTFYYGRSCPKWSVTEDATIPCIRYGELYTKFGAKIDRVYSYTNMPPENLRFSKGTEVLIPRVGEDPMDYNHCTWLSMPDVAIGEMISVFNTDNNPLFTATMFNATLQNEFAMRVEGGSVTNLYFEKLKNIEVSFPSIQEQEKIAAYFENLDHLITLHQRKCEETKSLKKYMLQKMFPENGKCVPKIRFSGFSDAWEQRKLDNVAEFSKGRGYSKGDLIGLGTPIILYGRLYTNYETSISDVDTYVEAKDGSVYSRGGEVIVPASGESAEDIARAATVDKSGILLGGDLNVVMPNEDINSGFLAISISNGNPQRELAKRAQGKSVVHIHNEEIRNLRVPFPIKVEQNKIVEYFFNLDHLITLHQHKCDELQKLKKFMLQNMFV